LENLVPKIPDNQLVLETDSPYLPPWEEHHVQPPLECHAHCQSCGQIKEYSIILSRENC